MSQQSFHALDRRRDVGPAVLAVSMECTTSARRSLNEGTIVTRVGMAKVAALTLALATRVRG
jgi:hypothetical protein